MKILLIVRHMQVVHSLTPGDYGEVFFIFLMRIAIATIGNSSNESSLRHSVLKACCSPILMSSPVRIMMHTDSAERFITSGS